VRLFIDTSGLYTLLDESGVSHERAAHAWNALESSGWVPVTSNYVVVEALTLARARLGAPAAKRMASELLPVVETRWIDSELHRTGLEAWLATGPSQVSLVDRVSFALMRAESISTAFALDPDFRTAGFEVIPA
jgi:predicted nucleic acid-binding protein